MGEDNFPGFLDPDHLRQISERFPELAGGLPDIPGAATFVRDMEAAKAKAEVAFRRCETAEKWGDTRTDQEDIEVLVDLAGRFGTFYRWRPAACAYVWKMVSAYLRSPIADCKPETFEDLAHMVIDVYSERVYEEKLKPYEKNEWITYERSKAEFQEYVRWQLDPLVQAECLDRWHERIARDKTNADDRDKLRPKTDYVPREPVRRTRIPQSLREPREFNRKWLDDVHRWLRDQLQEIVGPEENESALVGNAAEGTVVVSSVSAAARLGAELATSDGDTARTQSDLATKRQSVVMPILKQKRWSRGKLVTESGVGKNSVYEYLDGKRNPGYDNRKAMADALGLKIEDLPE